METAAPINATIGLGGPSTQTFGQTGVYGVTLHSITNADTPYVYFEFGAPNVNNTASGIIPGPRLVFSSNLTGTPSISGVPFADLSSTVNLNGEFESQGFAYDFGEQTTASATFTIHNYPGLDALLAQDPNFLAELTPDEIQQLSFTFYIQAAATPMTAAEYVSYQKKQADTLRTNILADSTAPSALKQIAANQTTFENDYLAALAQAGQLRADRCSADRAKFTRSREPFVHAGRGPARRAGRADDHL